MITSRRNNNVTDRSTKTINYKNIKLGLHKIYFKTLHENTISIRQSVDLLLIHLPPHLGDSL